VHSTTRLEKSSDKFFFHFPRQEHFLSRCACRIINLSRGLGADGAKEAKACALPKLQKRRHMPGGTAAHVEVAYPRKPTRPFARAQ
jgi:hypothetical protein